MKTKSLHFDDIIQVSTSADQWKVNKSDPVGGWFIECERIASRFMERIGPICLEKAVRWLSLSRIDPYWMEPYVGATGEAIPADTQLLLWERSDGLYGVILPLVCADCRTTLASDEHGIHLRIKGELPASDEATVALAYIGYGADYAALVEKAMHAAAARVKTFRLREAKSAPPFLQGLGWCTWDAFYHEVDEAKLLEGLESFKTGGVIPQFIILDDGAWDTEGDWISDFSINASKFPSGLGPFIQKVKQCYGVTWFGIWHAFQGYWAGIQPEGALARRFAWFHNRAVIRPWAPEEVDLYLVEPEEAPRLYNELYQFLAEVGVDMVKVDGQSALELFAHGKRNVVSTMRAYQEAMQSAAQRYFDGNLIHSMCHGSDIPFHMNSSLVWRNSQDYFPTKGMADQQKHIYVNAMNNIWSSTFAIPDWDMFQTHQEGAAFHAAARSISGGPIYVCDKPGQQNFDLLQKLTISGGVVLRCESPALPTADCVLVNCLGFPQILKVRNYAGVSGLLGLFHCFKGGGRLSTSISSRAIPGLTGERFAVYCNRQQMLRIVAAEEELQLTLDTAEYELVSFTPIQRGFAPIGITDKFNHAGSIAEWEVTENGHKVFVKDGGAVILMYCETIPQEVRIDGCGTDFTYDEVHGILHISAPIGNAVVIEVLLTK
ncbi:hypothetical protein A8709_15645 [Paenibacillus pectinilyticus]|uniref:Raffinose synthase n=1 Tax=Paenibacillus pectinilyticus TaxID=512399 RepID=A0A1C1A4L3_9BACL|nr:Sip1-related alpha-galactosidase [Paenibacillus pectinilyticus]OCT15507.1 hypothetical protein A8709_15645 [Paenibacillus pectinilyticus]